MIEISWTRLDGEYAKTPSAVTIGVFDGLHRGHAALINRVVHSDWFPVVVTFVRHPTELLLHDDVPGFIMSVRQKRHALRAAGVRLGVFIEFTEQFRQLPGREFLQALADRFDLRRLVVGHDFRCGYQLDTDVEAIRSYFTGTQVEVIAVNPVMIGPVPVSSTRVRTHIGRGEIGEAEKLLGRAYALDVSDEEVEREDGRAYIVKGPRGLLPESRQLVPARGTYRVELQGSGTRETELEIGENSLSWPLAADESIRYIVMKERRHTSKE